MRPAARLQAAIELLDEIIVAARGNGAAADALARKFFAKRRYAGSKDRRAIRELVWRAIREFGDCPDTARSAYAAMADDDADIAALFDGSDYGPAQRSPDEAGAKPRLIPAWIEDALSDLVTDDEKVALLNRAPLDIRINPHRISREDALAQLPEAEILPSTSSGLRLPRGFKLEEHPLYKDGMVDVQDLGSQTIVQACRVQPGMTVIDLCAGAGGKTLALAEAMAGEGRLIASDTNRDRLSKLVPRAQRAGFGDEIDAILLNPGQELDRLSDFQGQADIVLVDAPCSGSGTWRRNPETRWRLTPKRLDKLRESQANLLGIASALVKPGGVMLYAVCSLLSGEGESQASDFLSKNNGWQGDDSEIQLGRSCGAGRVLTPHHDGSDGFFFARLKNSC